MMYGQCFLFIASRSSKRGRRRTKSPTRIFGRFSFEPRTFDCRELKEGDREKGGRKREKERKEGEREKGGRKRERKEEDGGKKGGRWRKERDRNTMSIQVTTQIK